MVEQAHAIAVEMVTFYKESHARWTRLANETTRQDARQQRLALAADALADMQRWTITLKEITCKR